MKSGTSGELHQICLPEYVNGSIFSFFFFDRTGSTDFNRTSTPKIQKIQKSKKKNIPKVSIRH
jgi:hypothetical protein